MLVNVRMLAYAEPYCVREVEIPEPEPEVRISDILSVVFHHGQNDFQPKPCPSVSMGDVIEYGDDFYLICATGFRRLTADELREYEALERRDRVFSPMVFRPTG